jgi:hypothetical protein
VRALRSALAVASPALLAVALAGCFTFRSTITVRPDGSGTVVETLALSGPAARMGDEAPLSSAAALRTRATALGEGVTLVGTDTSGMVRTTTYAFRDLAALRYRLPDNAAEAQNVAAAAGQPPLYTFAFERPAGPDGAATLRVLVPESPASETAPPDTAALAQAARGLEFARVLFGDARATVDLVVAGEIDATDVPLVDGRATLLDLAFGPLFDLVERHPELATRQAPPLDEVRRLGEGREGLVVQRPGTFAVRFR